MVLTSVEIGARLLPLEKAFSEGSSQVVAHKTRLSICHPEPLSFIGVKMAQDKPCQNILGTTVFDANHAGKSYYLSQCCMSLMKAANRQAFKADERLYLDQ